MGLFGFFQKVLSDEPKQKSVPTKKDGSTKTFDYFAFKVHGVATIPEAQSVLANLGCKLHEQPDFAKIKLEGDCLNVYLHGQKIGSGDATAKKKFQEHCNNKWNIHSCSIYGGEDDKSFGCKIRIKYFY